MTSNGSRSLKGTKDGDDFTAMPFWKRIDCPTCDSKAGNSCGYVQTWWHRCATHVARKRAAAALRFCHECGKSTNGYSDSYCGPCASAIMLEVELGPNWRRA